MSKRTSSKSCSVCGKPPSPAHTPFCSQGCRDRDLLQWLGEGYRIAGPPADESEVSSEGRED
jgi:endogenous inhibitor of DNA gyrase (YacG/DUF329 family)